MSGWTEISKDGAANNWTIMQLEGNALQDVKTGKGLEALRSALDDTKIQFAALKVIASDDMSNRAKFVQINWIGPKVPAMKRIGALSAKPLAAEVYTSIGVFCDTNDRDDLHAKVLAKRMLGAGGAHKPLSYDFGDDHKFLLADLDI